MDKAQTMEKITNCELAKLDIQLFIGSLMI